jgi:Polyketide cyclase / dehydrase and lipid transport
MAVIRPVRIVTQTDGAVFREVLVALSDVERSYAYTFVGSPVPVRDHLTTLRVLPVTDGDRSYAEWSSRFESDPEHEAQLVDLINRNFLAGLRSLAKNSTMNTRPFVEKSASLQRGTWRKLNAAQISVF